MGAVLGVAPLWGDFKADWMGGRLWAPGSGYTLKNVDYNNSMPTNSSANSGRNALHTMLLANPGTVEQPTLVACHSMGGQVAHKWMRENGPTSGINPATVKFYMSGNPEMPYLGGSFLEPVKMPPKYPGTTSHNIFCPTPAQHHGGWGVGYGPPTTCPWDITYIVGEWDGWCYWPKRWASNADAKKNAEAGKLMTGSHGWYAKGSFDNPRNVLWADPARPNIKFLIIPNELPMLNSVKDPMTKASETRRLLPIILSAYDLPWTPPPVEVDPRLPSTVTKSVFVPTVSPTASTATVVKPKPWWQFW